ncbi:hypothetical protein QUB42_32695 [Microcoleus sp. Aus8_D1]|uniref:hypothetical protein n=1 Tax=Microcoleus sp. Aus8_D1 TaxID=3055302 RepID=UPI002FD6AF66
MKTFTYRQSELPPIPPEVEAKVAELDTQIADLISKNAGNFLALQQIETMLSDCTDTCDLNLDCIQIAADDGDSEKQQCTLKDLSLHHKGLVHSLSFTNSILLNWLSNISGRTPEDISNEIETHAQIYSKPPTTAEIEEFIDHLTKVGKSNRTWYFKRMRQK